MPKTEIFISKGIFFKRLALAKGGRIDALFIEREGHCSLVDGIYVGRITKVLPAINAAFLDCGLRRPAFLSLDDASSKLEDKKKRAPTLGYVTEGAKVLVQVKSDETLGKGARVSSEISIAGRYLVLKPFVRDINVSRRILASTERQRLSMFIAREKRGDEGVTVRTAAVNRSDAVLSLDINELRQRWDKIQKLYQYTEKIGLIVPAPTGIQRFLTEQLSSKIDSIFVDDTAVFSEVKKYCERNAPEIVNRIQICDSSGPIFGEPNLEEQFEEILLSQVRLPSGGCLYFDETRAMTTVDVDSGEASDGGNRFSRILQTNIEAATELTRQLRLRNVGGLVAIDFIGMRYDNDKEKVLKILKKGFENDPCSVKVSGFSEFGVVEIARQRRGFSHASLIKELCAHCKGEGRKQTIMSIADDIIVTLRRKIFFSSGLHFSITGNIETINFIREKCSGPISDLEDKWAVSISFVSDSGLGFGEYRVLDVER